MHQYLNALPPICQLVFSNLFQSPSRYYIVWEIKFDFLSPLLSIRFCQERASTLKRDTNLEVDQRKDKARHRASFCGNKLQQRQHKSRSSCHSNSSQQKPSSSGAQFFKAIWRICSNEFNLDAFHQTCFLSADKLRALSTPDTQSTIE